MEPLYEIIYLVNNLTSLLYQKVNKTNRQKMDFENLKNKKINYVSGLIGNGKICPEELTRFYLKKISSDPRSEEIFTEVYKESAIASAKESKKRAKAGLRRGVLDGIPISVKDLVDIKGKLTGGGSSLTNKEKAKNKIDVFASQLDAYIVFEMKKDDLQYYFD